MSQIEDVLKKMGEDVVATHRVELKRMSDNVETKLVKLKELEMSISPKIELVFPDHTTVLNEVTHEKFGQVLKLASDRHNVLLVGMAGVGKTKSSEQVATALNLPFYAISVCSQTSKSDLVGYMNATGVYIKTHFRDAYENGGVFLMDEVDAGNANVMVLMNSALSNGYCAFPDKMVKRHKDFIFIASANTFGQGASRQYVGRNQLDAATLDRFTIVNFDLDSNLERVIARQYLKGILWLEVVNQTRQFVNNQAINALITPRATMKGASMLDYMDLRQVTEIVLLNGIGIQYAKPFWEFLEPTLKKVAADMVGGSSAGAAVVAPPNANGGMFSVRASS